MVWYTVLKVPLLRSPVHSPLAAVAAAGYPLLLLWHGSQGKVLCHLGFDKPQGADMARAQLAAAGYILAAENHRFNFARPTALLERRVEPRVLLSAAKPVQAMLPAAVEEIYPDALFRLLASTPGAGFLLALRRSSGLQTKTMSQLPVDSWQDPVVQDLVNQPLILDLIGCVFGSPLAADLAVSAFPGLRAASPPDTTVPPEQLFQAAGAALRPAAKPLAYSFTQAEVSRLCSLTPGAGSWGLPLNKDTIPGDIQPSQQFANGLLLGRSADETHKITLPLDDLCKGLLLCGTPGSGKGNELFSLALQLDKAKIPFLMIEASKSELHHLGKRLSNLNCWTPTSGEYVFNPFSLPPGMTVSQYRACMMQMIRAAFRLDGPMEELFGAALENCLARYGFTDESTADCPGATPFGLQEFIEAYNDLLRSRGYSGKTEADMRTAGAVRLGSLFNLNRAVFDSCRTIPVNELIRGQNVLQLAPLATIQAKQLFATLLLISLGAWMRASFPHTGGKLKLVILLDEAHSLLCDAVRTTGESYSFPADFAALLLELRSAGVGFVISDQAATNLPQVITDVCASKIFMGSNSASGVADYAKEMALDEAALDHLYLLEPGDGLFRTTAVPMRQAVFFHTDNFIDLFHLEQPFTRKNSYLAAHPRMLIETFLECNSCPGKGHCSLADKARGRSLGQRLTSEWNRTFAQCLALPQHTEEQRTAQAEQLSRLLRALLIQSRQQAVGWDWYCGLVQFERAFNREASRKIRIDTILQNAKKLDHALHKKKEA